MPGVVGAHVHSGQRLGRGVADDTALLEWLYENVLPMEAAMGPGVMEIAATYRLPRTDRERRHYLHRPPLGRPRRPAVRGRGEVGIRGLLGKVLMDRDAPEGLREESDEALAEEYHVRIHVHASENLEEVARVRERTGMGNVG
jgi:cytosine/adenosine deaminase-related metal-dependent hydrolase